MAGDFLTPVISCLHHDNADVSNAALAHVADLALLMSEGMAYSDVLSVSVCMYLFVHICMTSYLNIIIISPAYLLTHNMHAFDLEH